MQNIPNLNNQKISLLRSEQYFYSLCFVISNLGETLLIGHQLVCFVRVARIKIIQAFSHKNCCRKYFSSSAVTNVLQTVVVCTFQPYLHKNQSINCICHQNLMQPCRLLLCILNYLFFSVKVLNSAAWDALKAVCLEGL